MRVRSKLILGGCAIGVVALVVAARGIPFSSSASAVDASSPGGLERPAEAGPEDADEPKAWVMSAGERADALARAQIWRQPATPISRATLDGPIGPMPLACSFELTDVGGTSPKFHCQLDEDTSVRVKYGLGAEIPAETAATRLLSALGFAADHITLVSRLRCYGCPKEPFTLMRFADATHTRSLLERVVDHERYEEFAWVAMERKFRATPIETAEQKGWAVHELEDVDPARGGAPRAHVDALRLLALFLAHWDNKSDNQRLVCLSAPREHDTRCEQPLLMIQDLGATFGPNKFDLSGWERAGIWEDRASCSVSMRELPYGGATFNHVRVAEDGRQFLLRLLDQLSDAQLTALFSGARFDKPRSPLARAHPVSAWVRVFRNRVEQIRSGPPCPAA